MKIHAQKIMRARQLLTFYYAFYSNIKQLQLFHIVLTFLISSKLWISGESPPWTHKNCWFIKAARGKQSNDSMQASYTFSVYFILPERNKVSQSILWRRNMRNQQKSHSNEFSKWNMFNSLYFSFNQPFKF